MMATLQRETERRAHERVEHSGDVQVVRDGLLLDAMSKDLAAGGMCLVFGEPTAFRVGDLVVLRFRLPRLSEATEARGCVRWLGGPDGILVGVQFTEGLRAREVWALNQLRTAGDVDP